jgi:RNA polymerase sigma factor (sigma-70 family)
VSGEALRGFLRRVEPAGGPSDAELLSRYVERRDTAAFELLAWRHGAVALGVCRRVLRHEQDAEDAFQAALLVLARKASSVGEPAALPGWLHKVAYRCALAAAARRPKHEVPLECEPLARPAADHGDSLAVLDAEVARLPARYRIPFVLCDIEGRTLREAATILGLVPDTVATRVRRARERLRERLLRRGVAAAAVPAALAVLADDARAGVPARLVSFPQALPERVTTIAERVVRMMWLKKLAAAAAVVVVIIGGAGVTYCGLSAGEPPVQPAKPAEAPPAKVAKREPDSRLMKVLDQALKDAETIENPFMRSAAFGSVAEAQAKAGQNAAARATIQRALTVEESLPPDAGDQKNNRLITLALAQGKSGEVAGAVRLLNEKVSGQDRTTGLSNLAVTLAISGKIKEAKEVAEKVEGDRDEIMLAIAAGQIGAGDRKGARETAEQVKGSGHHRAHILAGLMLDRAKSGAAVTEKEFDEVKAALPAQGDAKQLGQAAVAAAHVARGEHDKARDVAGAIEDDQWRARALRGIANAQATLGKLDEARKTLAAIADDYNRGEAQHDVVEVLLKAKNLAAAKKEIETITAPWAKCYCLIDLAKALAAAGQRDEARPLLDEALKVADTLTDPVGFANLRESALGDANGARAALGDVDGALAWADKQADAWTRLIARIRIADALTQ